MWCTATRMRVLSIYLQPLAISAERFVAVLLFEAWPDVPNRERSDRYGRGRQVLFLLAVPHWQGRSESFDQDSRRAPDWHEPVANGVRMRRLTRLIRACDSCASFGFRFTKWFEF